MEDARRFGLPEEAIAAIEQAEGSSRASGTEVAIWPENSNIVAAFLAVWSQWNVAPVVSALGVARMHYAGLDYAGARAGLKGDGIEITPRLWAGIRTMEAAARVELNR